MDLLSEAITDEYDCELEAISNPVEGLEIAQEQKYDLILVDYVMPQMSGKKFVESLRANPGINQKTPIVILSAYLENVEKEVKNIKDVSFFDKMYYLTNLIPYLNMILANKK